MTVYGLTAALAWASLGAFFVRRLDAFAHRWLDRSTPVPPLDAKQIDIPEDLQALVMGESEKWAADATLEAIRERYVTYGNDWNKVRAAFGLGAMN